MRILIDITHPAHVHFFKNAWAEFQKRGHELRVGSRDKDITVALLDALDIGHKVLSKAPREKVVPRLVSEMVAHCRNLYRLSKEFRQDVMLQVAGTFVAPVGIVARVPSVVFYDTENATVSNLLSYNLATVVCTPECYEGWGGPRHVRYPGYHELAYLHPDRFKPDPKIIENAGLSVDEKYFLFRFTAHKALHDFHENALNESDKVALVNEVAKHGRVLISSESELPPELAGFVSPMPPELVHHAIAFAAGMFGDSATMASEAAVLGVPAVFISKTDRGYTNEQERRYGLVKTVRPHLRDDYMAAVLDIASMPLKENRAGNGASRARLLAERVDTTAWLVDFVESRYGRK